MEINRQKAMVTASLALALLITPALSGCFTAEDVAQEAAEKIVEDQTGADIEIDAEGTQLPNGWPAEVEVVKGDISNAVSYSDDAGTTWAAEVAVSDAEAGYTDAKKKLEAAGFATDSETSFEGSYSGSFSNGTYAVVITAAAIDGGAFVSYLVTTTQ